jgi:hypothetical protein
MPVLPRGPLLVGSCVIVLGATSVAVRYIDRSIMHVDENEFIVHVCDEAAKNPISPNVARALLNTWEENLGDMDREWLTCVVDEKGTCSPPRSLKVAHGVFSALPRRYWVDVEIENGIVTVCKVSSAPGW